MNRAQRRAGGIRGHLPTEERNWTADYGHDGQRVVVIFSQPIGNRINITIEQTREMIKALEVSIDKLIDHQSSKTEVSNG